MIRTIKWHFTRSKSIWKRNWKGKTSYPKKYVGNHGTIGVYSKLKKLAFSDYSESLQSLASKKKVRKRPGTDQPAQEVC